MHHIVNCVKPFYAWKLMFTKRPTDLKTLIDIDNEKSFKRKYLKEKILKYLRR